MSDKKKVAPKHHEPPVEPVEEKPHTQIVNEQLTPAHPSGYVPHETAE